MPTDLEHETAALVALCSTVRTTSSPRRRFIWRKLGPNGWLDVPRVDFDDEWYLSLADSWDTEDEAVAAFEEFYISCVETLLAVGLPTALVPRDLVLLTTYNI